MARLPYLEKTDLAPEDHDLLARPITLFKCMTHSPKAARAFHGLGHFIRHESRLDPRLRELAILAVGWVTRSPYEWSHHVKISQDFGVTDDDIKGLITELDGKSNSLDPVAKLVIKAAREMTTTLTVPDATFAALKIMSRRNGRSPDLRRQNSGKLLKDKRFTFQTIVILLHRR